MILTGYLHKTEHWITILAVKGYCCARLMEQVFIYVKSLIQKRPRYNIRTEGSPSGDFDKV